MILRTGHDYDWHQARLNRIADAIQGSELTFARVQGMRIRAAAGETTQIVVRPFPYPGHRTCAQWRVP